MEQIPVYQVAAKNGRSLTKKQLVAIGMQAKELFIQITGEKPEKIYQSEKGADNLLKHFKVNAFPLEFEVILANILEKTS